MRKDREYEIQFEIENACLLDCVHCSSLTMRESGKCLYTNEQMIEFISGFPGPVHVYLTGGEPLLKPDLISLCQSICSYKSNISIGLYTTGNYLHRQPISEEFAVALAHSGVKDCYFSIYDNDSLAHDLFTGCPGSFNNTIISAKTARAAGIQPKVHLVLNRQNYEKLDEIISFCRDAGFVEVRVLKLTPSGRAKDNWSEIGIPSEEQNKTILSLIQRRDCFGIKLSFSGYPDLHPCRASAKAVKCQAGTNLLYVTLSGDIFPCACTVRFADCYKIGNIADISEVWKHLGVQYQNEYNKECLNEL